jgi:membrane fusion protein (multidrug efflux system)
MEEVRSDGTQAEARPAARRRGPKPIFIIAAFAVVAVAGWLVYHLLTAGKESTDDAEIQADVVPLSARVAGPVVRVFVKENQQVRQGEPILQVDQTDYRARVREAQANYDSFVAQATAADAQVQVAEAGARGGFSSAEAQVSSSTAGVSGSEADVAAARAAVIRAQADRRRSELDFQRARQLLAAQAIPRQQFDNARAAYDASQAAVTQARAQVRAAEDGRRAAQQRVLEAQGRLGTSRPVQAQIEAAQANAKLAHAKADAAAAQLDSAKLLLDYTLVSAPADGVVSNLGVHAGQYVQPGQALVQLVPNETYVIANFKETQLDRMRVGQRAVVSVDAYGGRKLEARIESFSGGTGARFSLLPPDNATGNFVKVVQRIPVRLAWVRLPSELPPLRAGLSVTAKVYESEQAGSPAPAGQPAAAVGRRP